jgi:hypothetical protein
MQGRYPELSLWVLIFVLSTRLLGFLLSTSGFLTGQTRSRMLHVQYIPSERARQMSGLWSEAQLLGGVLIFLN